MPLIFLVSMGTGVRAGAGNLTASPVDFVTQVYKDYLSARPLDYQKLIRTKQVFTRGALTLFDKDWAACKKAGEAAEACGFGGDGDPFLNARDASPKLTFENSEFKAMPTGPATVDVVLNVIPGDASGDNRVAVRYAVLKEKGRWKIDDIFYGVEGKFPNESSMRNQITSELEDLAHPSDDPVARIRRQIEGN